MHRISSHLHKYGLGALCVLGATLWYPAQADTSDNSDHSGILGQGIIGEVRERIGERTEAITNRSGILSSSDSLDPGNTEGPLRQITHAATQPVKEGLSEVLPTHSAPMTHSGFLQSYEGFIENPATGALIWQKEPGALAHYDSFVIAPVIVYPAADAEFKGVHPGELQKLSNYFKAELTQSLTAAGYRVVDRAAPKTAVLRIAIVNLKPANPIAYAGSWMPYARIADAANTATGGTPMGVGSISIEAEMLDSVSGEPQAAVIDTLFGKKIAVRQNLNKWDEIANAVRTWASRFTGQVVKAHQTGRQTVEH